MINCKIVDKIYENNRLKYYKLKVLNENNYGLFESSFLKKAIKENRFRVINADVEKNIKDTEQLYERARKLSAVSSNFKAIDLRNGLYFIKCSELYVLFISDDCIDFGLSDGFNVYSNLLKEGINVDAIKHLKVVGGNNLQTAESLFRCLPIESIDLHNFVTSKVTNMDYMFYGATFLKQVDLSCLCTENVGYMIGLFSGCKSFESLDLRDFNTSQVKSMSCMFANCTNLKSVLVDNFDVSKVCSMSNMFIGCSNLESLDLSSFNTDSIKFMDKMFNGCKRLFDLKFNYKQDGNITKSGMFIGCNNLDLGS